MPCRPFVGEVSTLRVLVSIVNWEDSANTIGCVESVVRSTVSVPIIVIVDNASRDDSADRVRAWVERRGWYLKDVDEAASGKAIREVMEVCMRQEGGFGRPCILLVRASENHGFAGGHNIVLRSARRLDVDYIWMLNPDVRVTDSALEALVTLAEDKPRSGFIGAKILYAEEKSILQGIGVRHAGWHLATGRYLGQNERDTGQWVVPLELEHVIGASMLVRRSALNDVGLMDESYFLYGEETEWHIRAKRHGWSVWYCPDAVVYHEGSVGLRESGSPVESDFFSSERDYYCFRNALYTAARYYPLLLPLVISVQWYKAIRRLAYRKWANAGAIILAQRDFLLGRKGPRCRAASA